MFSAPYEPFATFKPDSRYFWLGEWLMYPWQIYTGINDHLDVGGSFEEFYYPWAGKMKMNLHYFSAPNSVGVMYNDQRNWRLSPVKVLLARKFWDSSMFEGSEGTGLLVNDAYPYFPGFEWTQHPEDIHLSRESHILEGLEPV
jgi:hypothetical protein